MGGQNRIIVAMLGTLAALVLIIGGLSAALLFRGGEDGGGALPATGVGTTTEGLGDGGDGAVGGGDGAGGGAGGRLRLPGSDPVTLDPHLAGDSDSAEYIVEIFSGLVTITPELEIELDLAESLEVSEDGLRYTFTLRDDAFFHNGRRVTAEDVRWSIDRAASPELSSPTALPYLGDIAGVRDRFYGRTETIAGVEVVDDRTVRFTIDAPKPFFLAKLTYPTAFVVDSQQIGSNPRGWTRRPIGTGPYRMQEWRLGERIVLRANPRHHSGEPPIREVLYELSGGSTLTRFENGELDVARVSVKRHRARARPRERHRPALPHLRPVHDLVHRAQHAGAAVRRPQRAARLRAVDRPRAGGRSHLPQHARARQRHPHAAAPRLHPAGQDAAVRPGRGAPPAGGVEVRLPPRTSRRSP